MSNVAHRLTSTISAINSSTPLIGVRGIADWRLWIVDCELKRGCSLLAALCLLPSAFYLLPPAY
ncbi:MAG: hypothetical protein Q8M58_12460 [Anaerolineales bacterium]|nr:hypothetical protein [Anaerolineales bacterium]